MSSSSFLPPPAKRRRCHRGRAPSLYDVTGDIPPATEDPLLTKLKSSFGFSKVLRRSEHDLSQMGTLWAEYCAKGMLKELPVLEEACNEGDITSLMLRALHSYAQHLLTTAGPEMLKVDRALLFDLRVLRVATLNVIWAEALRRTREREYDGDCVAVCNDAQVSNDLYLAAMWPAAATIAAAHNGAWPYDTSLEKRQQVVLRAHFEEIKQAEAVYKDGGDDEVTLLQRLGRRVLEEENLETEQHNDNVFESVTFFTTGAWVTPNHKDEDAANFVWTMSKGLEDACVQQKMGGLRCVSLLKTLVHKFVKQQRAGEGNGKDGRLREALALLVAATLSNLYPDFELRSDGRLVHSFAIR